MSLESLPLISVIIPTLNSSRTLAGCLESIIRQEYPCEKLEVLIADAGSTDPTREILRRMQDLTGIPLKVLDNPLRTGEAGKAAAARQAKGDILAFIDSDNILPDTRWLAQMAAPFSDAQIAASEPIRYTYRAGDGLLTRYCALLGMNDPLCLFLGNYDRESMVTGTWTGIPLEAEPAAGYLKVRLVKGPLPTIGANGFLIRREILMHTRMDKYLFDIDVLAQRIAEEGSIYVAKVDTGIVHLFAGSLRMFARKQKRRVRDYFYFRGRKERSYDWGALPRARLAWFVAACLLIVPLFAQAIRGYARKPDPAWMIHPLACWITLWQYGWGSIGAAMGRSAMLERNGWEQR